MDSFAPVNGQGLRGLSSIASSHRLNGMGQVSAVSVVFAANTRPSADALRELAKKSGQFSVSFDPGTESPGDGGWVELLTSGLTFDCSGLMPGPPDELPERVQSFGLQLDEDFSGSESVTIVPGPHLMGGGAMFPVVRCLALLGALLSGVKGAQAVSWHSARNYVAPDQFRSRVTNWFEGGAFPAFDLTALVPIPGGGIASEGLGLFIGQEIQLAPDIAPTRNDAGKIALRLIDYLIGTGRIDAPSQMVGPSGEGLLLTPTAGNQIIKVSRSS